ncbi:MAG TPA: hypothetical protein VIH88_07485 [Candidatus Acidoferrales bacterium]
MNKKRIIWIAQLTLTAVAALMFTGHAEATNHRSSDKIIVVGPADLPELARVTGQAMMLHDTMDGRTLLYIEQNQGARLAIFDVTDPAHVKAQGSAQVAAPGSFDFVSSLGADAVLVRFRNGQGEAVLNLHKVKTPTLDMIQGLYLQGSMEFLGDEGLIVVHQPSVQSDPNDKDYQVVDISNPLRPNPVTDIKQVLEKITNYETGTTFLLTADGLYLIRQPAAEEEFRMRQQQMRHTP